MIQNRPTPVPSALPNKMDGCTIWTRTFNKPKSHNMRHTESFPSTLNLAGINAGLETFKATFKAKTATAEFSGVNWKKETRNRYRLTFVASFKLVVCIVEVTERQRLQHIKVIIIDRQNTLKDAHPTAEQLMTGVFKPAFQAEGEPTQKKAPTSSSADEDLVVSDRNGIQMDGDGVPLTVQHG